MSLLFVGRASVRREGAEVSCSHGSGGIRDAVSRQPPPHPYPTPLSLVCQTVHTGGGRTGERRGGELLIEPVGALQQPVPCEEEGVVPLVVQHRSLGWCLHGVEAGLCVRPPPSVALHCRLLRALPPPPPHPLLQWRHGPMHRQRRAR